MGQDEALQKKLQDYHQLGKDICQSMLQAIEKMGFSELESMNKPIFDKAVFSLHQDPFTQEENLTGYWYDDYQQRIGNIQFNSDGSFYAEYDIVRLHPSKKNWFVEAMSAWGTNGNIKTEAKLLPTV